MVISLITAIAGFIADFKIKNHIEKNYELGKTVRIKESCISIHKTYNYGFAMNKLSKKRGIVLGISTVVFVLFLACYALFFGEDGRMSAKIALGLALGGAAGNLYDRWKRAYVVDYIQLSCFKKIIFNLADVLLVTGCLITMVDEIYHFIRR